MFCSGVAGCAASPLAGLRAGSYVWPYSYIWPYFIQAYDLTCLQVTLLVFCAWPYLIISHMTLRSTHRRPYFNLIYFCIAQKLQWSCHTSYILICYNMYRGKTMSRDSKYYQISMNSKPYHPYRGVVLAKNHTDAKRIFIKFLTDGGYSHTRKSLASYTTLEIPAAKNHTGGRAVNFDRPKTQLKPRKR